jgi:hypothetical protein
VAAFLVWFALWLAGGLFGPVQYHPSLDAQTQVYPEAHESGTGR